MALEMYEEDQILLYLYWTQKLPKLIAIQASIYSWLQQVYDERPVVPPHQVANYHKG